MTSKEALKNICLECEKEMAKNQTRCPFRSISNEYCKEYETIKKDLEILEILKNNEISISYIEQSTSYDDYISKCDCFRNLSYIAEEEYTKLKEWLEK